MRKLLQYSGLVLGLALLLVSTPAVQAKSVAMEYDGTPGCVSVDDMGLATVGSGVTETFDLYFHDIPMPALSVACTFCIQDVSSVDLGTINFTSNMPGGWTITPIAQIFDIDPVLQAAYPNIGCWLVQATDFTFAIPWSGGSIGSFQFTTTAETCIGFVIDGRPTSTGIFYTDFSTAGFEAPGEICDPFVCPGTATEIEAWGGIKTLFR